jgi:hypothetical protein
MDREKFKGLLILQAQDDTKLVAEEGGVEGETGDELEDVHGFVFSKLKSLHPDKGDKLAEMKQYLLGRMDQVDV